MVGFDWGGICRRAGITPGPGLAQGTWNGLAVRVTVKGPFRGLQVALVPPPAPLVAQVPAWQALAARHRLDLQGTPPRLRGLVDRYRVELVATRTGEGRHEVELWVTPEPPRPLPAGGPARKKVEGSFGKGIEAKLESS